MARRGSLAKLAAFGLLAALSLPTQSAQAIVRGKPVPGIALYGEPKYGADFKNFEYVNPDAPKGGTFVKSNEALLTFDTFNPFTLKGSPAYGTDVLMHDTLMAASLDEPSSMYGLVAETIEIAPDDSWVQFVINPSAKFNDGSAITADDVVFSFQVLLDKARPQYKFIYANVGEAKAVDPRTVRFTIKSTEDRKLPLLLAALPVLSKAYWKDRDFAATTLDIPVVSGPYTIETFEVGKYVLYQRLGNYWGKNLPVVRGMYNFDHVRYEYFRDADVEFEAFKNGSYDFTREVVARRWATAYDFPAFNDGRVKKLEVPSIQPRDVTTFVFNLRRPLFQDRRVREAFNYAFDFESLNKNIMYGLYDRLHSYWQGSPLEATGLPSEAEVKLLEPFRGKVPDAVFTSEFKQPTTAGDGADRDNLVKARDLLTAAGWDVKDGQLFNKKTGQSFKFEIMLVQANLEQVLSPWLQNLKRLGIEATLRIVDTSQYINRVNDYDYDAIYIGMNTSLTPGTELMDSLSSEAADRPGSSNYGGIKDPVVDALIKRIISADDYETVTTATRALDRVLTNNYYAILRYAMAADRYAYWTKLKMPATQPALGLGSMGETALALWWADAATPATSSAKPASTPSSSNTWIIVVIVIVIAAGAAVVIRRRKA